MQSRRSYTTIVGSLRRRTGVRKPRGAFQQPLSLIVGGYLIVTFITSGPRRVHPTSNLTSAGPACSLARRTRGKNENPIYAANICKTNLFVHERISSNLAVDEKESYIKDNPGCIRFSERGWQLGRGCHEGDEGMQRKRSVENSGAVTALLPSCPPKTTSEVAMQAIRV